MKRIEPTVTIQYLDKMFNVDDMSEQCQLLIECLDKAREREQQLIVNLTTERAAIRGIYSALEDQIQQEQRQQEQQDNSDSDT